MALELTITLLAKLQLLDFNLPKYKPSEQRLFEHIPHLRTRNYKAQTDRAPGALSPARGASPGAQRPGRLGPGVLEVFSLTKG